MNYWKDEKYKYTEEIMRVFSDKYYYDDFDGKIKSIKTNKPIGRKNSDGYLMITFTVNKKQYNYLAHRLIWFLNYGEIPKNEIDHINRDRSDNRLINIRCVTRGENMLNCKKFITNTSGYVGVSWHKQHKKWYAYYKRNQKVFSIGLFINIEDASKAVENKKMELQKCA